MAPHRSFSRVRMSTLMLSRKWLTMRSHDAAPEPAGSEGSEASGGGRGGGDGRSPCGAPGSEEPRDESGGLVDAVDMELSGDVSSTSRERASSSGALEAARASPLGWAGPRGRLGWPRSLEDGRLSSVSEEELSPLPRSRAARSQPSSSSEKCTTFFLRGLARACGGGGAAAEGERGSSGTPPGRAPRELGGRNRPGMKADALPAPVPPPPSTSGLRPAWRVRLAAPLRQALGGGGGVRKRGS